MRRLDEPFYKSDLGFESNILDDILPLGSTAENETVAFDLYLVQSWKLLYCFFTLIGLMKIWCTFSPPYVRYVRGEEWNLEV